MTITFVCGEKCQWRGRVWEAGESVQIPPGQDFPPRHFTTNDVIPSCPLGPPARETDFLLVVGDSPYTERQLAGFSRPLPFSVAAVNYGARRWSGTVDFVVTIHENILPRMAVPGAALISDKCNGEVLNRVVNLNPAGGSGFAAVHLGLLMGFPKILLAGIDLISNQYLAMRPAFENCVERSRIRSLGGWPVEVFGEPEPGWMEG